MIRKATNSDAPIIQTLWNIAIRDTLITFNSTEKSEEDVVKAIASYDAFLVAEVEGHVIGFAALFPFRSGVGYAHTKEHSIMLDPEERGRGMGRKLMAALEGEARKQDVHSLIAGISASNPDGEPFHAAIGFETIGRMREVGHKFGQWHDLILMQKHL